MPIFDDKDSSLSERNENQKNIEIIEEINSGAYANVYKGKDYLDRIVAVKIMRESPIYLSNPANLQNTITKIILNHAKLLAQVEHENIVRVYYITKVIDPASKKYVDSIVMEYLPGITLDEKLKKVLSKEEASLIGNSISNGLKAMHQKSIAHSDLHEGNIIVLENKVKIIDPFGDETTFALLLTLAKEKKYKNDINQLKGILRDLINKIPDGKVDVFRDETKNELDIDQIKDIFNKCINYDDIISNPINILNDIGIKKKLDLKTYQKIKELLPYDKTIEFIKIHDFAGSFDWADLKDFDDFVAECKNPEFELYDTVLEDIKLSLKDNIQHFLSYLSQNSEYINSSNRVRVRSEWFQSNPEKFEKVICNIHNLCTVIVSKYNELIKTCRLRLEI